MYVLYVCMYVCMCILWPRSWFTSTKLTDVEDYLLLFQCEVLKCMYVCTYVRKKQYLQDFSGAEPAAGQRWPLLALLFQAEDVAGCRGAVQVRNLSVQRDNRKIFSNHLYIHTYICVVFAQHTSLKIYPEIYSTYSVYMYIHTYINKYLSTSFVYLTVFECILLQQCPAAGYPASSVHTTRQHESIAQEWRRHRRWQPG
jgi:hypothetical protein